MAIFYVEVTPQETERLAKSCAMEKTSSGTVLAALAAVEPARWGFALGGSGYLPGIEVVKRKALRCTFALLPVIMAFLQRVIHCVCNRTSDSDWLSSLQIYCIR